MHAATLATAVAHHAPSAPLTTQEITRVGDLAAHEGEWRRLVEELPEATLYNTWEWTSAKLESYWPTAPVAVLLIRRDGRLVGAAPLIVDRGADVWCRGALTVPEERVDFPFTLPAAEVLDAALGHLGRTRRHWRLGLLRCPASSPLVPALPEAARARGLHAFVRPAEPSRLVVPGGGWDAYLGSRSKHVRHEWRRKRRQLEKQGRVEIRKVTTRAQFDEVLPGVLAIEEASWKHEAGLAISTQRRGRVFYPELARRGADRGWLRLHVLYLDSHPIAHFLGMRFRQRLYALWTSYDQSQARHSPGIAVVLAALEDAFASGVTTVDLLGAEMRWKREVANDLRQHVHACVYSGRAVGCRACSLARGTIRPALAARAPSLLRGLEQGLRRLKGQRGH